VGPAYQRERASERAGGPRCWADSVCWAARARDAGGPRVAGPSQRGRGEAARAAVFVFLFQKYE
jgi:hypothetical protein